jgi:prevent-host-death family protein
MKTIGIFEAKTRLSEICQSIAETGEPVTITRRGKALVRVEPVSDESLTIRERRAAYLEKYGSLEADDPVDFQTPARTKEEFSFRAGD